MQEDDSGTRTNLPLEEREIAALVSLIGDEDSEVRQHVYTKIRELGTGIIPYLENAWEQHAFDSGIQREYEDLIHGMQFEQLHQRLLNWFAEPEPDLLTGLWIVATYQYPNLQLAPLQEQINQIHYDIWIDLQEDMNAYEATKVIVHGMFHKLGFSANTKSFHSPANSMINQVLESRRGNPIALCAVYMLVAQKLRLPVYGVNLPNLFIVTYKDEEVQFYINVFNQGIVLSRKDIDDYLKKLKLPQNDVFYEPCSHQDIIKRVLRNLINSYERQGDKEQAAEIHRLLLEVSPDEHELP